MCAMSCLLSIIFLTLVEFPRKNVNMFLIKRNVSLGTANPNYKLLKVSKVVRYVIPKKIAP